MFTGIIEELGTVRQIRQAAHSLELAVAAAAVAPGLCVGDSVAVNGCCLTVTRLGGGAFTADVMPETFHRTNLRHLAPGDPVNLERTMQLGDRFGGHIVSGHIDGVGEVAAIAPAEIAQLFSVTAPPAVLRYLVPKGSVAIDGISLTVIDVLADRFTVGIIPHTFRMTTMGRRRPGDLVNLEADVIGKYVEKFVAARLPEQGAGRAGGLDAGFLSERGFIQPMGAKAPGDASGR